MYILLMSVFYVHFYVCSTHVCVFVSISMYVLPMSVFLCSPPCMFCPRLCFCVHLHACSVRACIFLSISMHVLSVSVLFCPFPHMFCPYLYFSIHPCLCSANFPHFCTLSYMLDMGDMRKMEKSPTFYKFTGKNNSLTKQFGMS